MPATKTRRGSSSRSKKKTTTRKPARKTTTSRAKAAPVPNPGVVARSREAAGRQLAGHRADLFAVCLFVLGAIFALGLWTELAGPVGSALADGSGAVLGRARVAIPVACFAFGVVLLWPRRAAVIDLEAADLDSAIADGDTGLDNGRPSRRPSASPSARSSSSSPTSASSTSPTAAPRSVATSTTCAPRGGALGAMVAGPLVAAIGVVGASVVLGAVALVGVLLVLGLSIGVIVGRDSRARHAPPRRRHVSR